MAKEKRWILSESHAFTRRNTLKVASGTIVGSTLSATSVSGQNTIEIEDWNDLNNMRNDLDGNYVLIDNLDIDTEGYDDHVANPATGFDPIGDDEEPFTGTFDGQNNEIQDLLIDTPDKLRAGLFGRTIESTTLSKINIVDCEVINDTRAGGLTGRNDGKIKQCSTSGNVTAEDYSGGIAGQNNGEITDSSAEVNVSGSFQVGGFVGTNSGDITSSSAAGDVTGDEGSRGGGFVGDNNGVITDSLASGNVDCDRQTGGFAARNTGNNAKIITSSASGDVISNNGAGGFVRYHSGARIEKSWATGDVTGDENVGGFVGSAFSNGGGFDTEIIESWSGGSVNGNKNVGGFVGRSFSTIIASWAKGSVTGDENIGSFAGVVDDGVESSWGTGSVEGENNVGGFVGLDDGFSASGYWDTESTGQQEGVGKADNEPNEVVGLLTTEMQGESAAQNMTALDFDETWVTVSEGDTFNRTVIEDGYPILQNVDTEPQLQGLLENEVKITNINLKPDEVEISASEHTLEFDAENVSADGTGDQFEVSFPDDVDLEGYSDVEIDDLSEENPVEQTDNTLTFSVNPSGGGSTRISVKLTVTLSASN